MTADKPTPGQPSGQVPNDTPPQVKADVRAYLLKKITSERDQYSRQIERLLNHDTRMRDWGINEEALVWSRAFVEVADEVIALLSADPVVPHD